MSKTYTFKFGIQSKPWMIIGNKVQQVLVRMHKVETRNEQCEGGVYYVTVPPCSIEKVAHEHELFVTKKDLLESL